MDKFFKYCSGCERFFFNRDEYRMHSCAVKDGHEMEARREQLASRNDPNYKAKSKAPADTSAPKAKAEDNIEKINKRSEKKQMCNVLKNLGVAFHSMDPYEKIKQIYDETMAKRQQGA